MSKRKLSKATRMKLRKNALKATRKWQRMSHKTRVRARRSPYYSWGFEGKSPHTRPRRYKYTKRYSIRYD